LSRVLAATVMIAEQRAVFDARTGAQLSSKSFERRLQKAATRTAHVSTPPSAG
jgi:site-specific recombinase XerC